MLPMLAVIAGASAGAYAALALDHVRLARRAALVASSLLGPVVLVAARAPGADALSFAYLAACGLLLMHTVWGALGEARARRQLALVALQTAATVVGLALTLAWVTTAAANG